VSTYIHHIHYVLLLFLEVPPTYTHYTLCYFYPRDTHLCCFYPRSTHSSIHHPHTFHIYLENVLLLHWEGIPKNTHCHYVLFYLSNKALVISVDTSYCYQCIKRVGSSLKNEKRKKEDKVPNSKEKKESQVLILRLDIHHQLSPFITTFILITHFISLHSHAHMTWLYNWFLWIHGLTMQYM